MDRLARITQALSRPGAIAPIDGLAVRVIEVRVVPRREPPINPANPSAWTAELQIRFAVPPLPDGTAWLPWREDTSPDSVASVVEEVGNWARAHVHHLRPPPPPDLDAIRAGLPPRGELWRELLAHLVHLSPVEDRGDGTITVVDGTSVSVVVTPEQWHEHVVLCAGGWPFDEIEEMIGSRGDASYVVWNGSGFTPWFRPELPPWRQDPPAPGPFGVDELWEWLKVEFGEDREVHEVGPGRLQTGQPTLFGQSITRTLLITPQQWADLVHAGGVDRRGWYALVGHPDDEEVFVIWTGSEFVCSTREELPPVAGTARERRRTALAAARARGEKIGWHARSPDRDGEP